MRAIICGAGIAGLALAWWLERDGWDVNLVEHATGPRDEGYMIDFLGSGYDVAERMGLLPRLRDIQTSNRVVEYVDPAGRSRGQLEYDGLAEIFGGRLFTFMRGDLERVLYEALGGRIPVRYSTTVDTVDVDGAGAHVGLSDGSTESADLLVGADGIHSRVRDLLFGDEAGVLRYLGYHTASYLFADDELRARVGDRFLIVAAPGRQVGIYPTNEETLTAWLVHHTADPTIPGDPTAAVQSSYEGLGALADRTIRQCPQGSDLYYDRVAQIELARWSRGPITLVGDSCQAVSLMAGQGASLAMGGAFILAGELRGGAPVDAALARYERRMKPFIRDKQASGRRTAGWLVPTTRWRIAARGLAVRAVSWPGMARLMRRAFGPMASSVVS